MTASGYRMGWDTMCVAHRSLPFGTVVQFHKDGNYCFAVVTDRGPYIYSREWDFQPAVTAALGSTWGHYSVDYRIVGFDPYYKDGKWA